MSALTQSPAWLALSEHAQAMAQTRIVDLNAGNAMRPADLTHECGALRLDFSRQRITADTLKLLCALARAQGFEAQREAMWRGDAVNQTEGRAALHVALRVTNGDDPSIGTPEQRQQARAHLPRLREIAHSLRQGGWKGATGKALQAVVHIGIGGSDLGPRMVVRALEGAATTSAIREVRFVANVDPADLQRQLRGLTPETTLFIIASKTFTTTETLMNAQAARAWLRAGGIDNVAPHFTAISNNVAAAVAFGIASQNVLPLPDWVGGRYSLWSAIGLPIAIACGVAQFEALLAGAHEVDLHFRHTPLEQNAPALLGLIGVWNGNFLGATSHAVLAYADALELFVNHLQQLEMESTGKRVNRAGEALDYQTCPVIWGGVGSNTQHSFHQLLHQGTKAVPVDFIVSLRAAAHHNPLAQRQLVANAFAQAAALGTGRASADDTLGAHRAYPGDRPSTTISCATVDARALGALIALYEHKVFTQSVVWGINPFDQFGVELGKVLAQEVDTALGGASSVALDPSTAALIAHWQQAQRAA